MKYEIKTVGNNSCIRFFGELRGNAASNADEILQAINDFEEKNPGLKLVRWWPEMGSRIFNMEDVGQVRGIWIRHLPKELARNVE